MTRRDPLTLREMQTLGAVRTLTVGQGYPPTICELAAALGIKKSAAHLRLKQLQAKGWLYREAPNMPRALHVSGLRVVLDEAEGGRRAA